MPDKTFRTLRGVVAESIAVSPRGDKLVCGGPELIMLSTITGRRIWSSGTSTDAAASVSFSPDGHLVASTSAGMTSAAVVWDAETGAQERKFIGGYGSAVFSPDSALLVTGGRGGALVWEVGTGLRVRTLGGGAEWVRYVACASSAPVVAAAEGRTVRVWDLDTGRLKAKIDMRDGGQLGPIALSPSGGLLAVPTASQVNGFVPPSTATAVAVWSVSSEATTPNLVLTIDTSPVDVRSLSFSPDGRLLASGGFLFRPYSIFGDWAPCVWGGGVRVWRVQGWHPAWQWNSLSIPGRDGEQVQALAFAPSGGWLAAATQDRAAPIRVWHTGT